MKNLTIGIIAHVDSGKTTLSEAMLYLSGSIRQFGRVDKGASFLDNDQLERSRGITIFSKQARFTYGDTSFVLIDTPGHTDFSAETERTLKILDAAILLISASEGIRPQTTVLWELLESYDIPVFIFFNKMDQGAGDRSALTEDIKKLTDDAAVDFTDFEILSGADDNTDPAADDIYEQIAMCSDEAMDEFLKEGVVSGDTIARLIVSRQLFPCFFGSALKMDKVTELLSAIDRYCPSPVYPEEFSAVVYKIGHDNDNTRLTFVKITGGSIRTKSLLPDGEGRSKINQIRLYSGDKFTLAEEASAGDICAFTGLKESYAGMTFGNAAQYMSPKLIPVLSYRVIPDEGSDPVTLLPVFRVLEEESPELSVTWDEDGRDIYIFVMGQVQLEIITSILKDRFNVNVTFDSGEVMYRETIASPVIGAGHFEPLRHYAEVHLLMEPLPEGSGLIFDRALSTDTLSENWQRQILSVLKDYRHTGVLTGSPLTDMRITLIAGKAHIKHTEGGDFRQACVRAVRQGLMMADSILLEPYYRFSLELPTDCIGRAMTDLERLGAVFSSPETGRLENMSAINGRGPVASLKDYPAELASYTKGSGSISFIPDGYSPCHDSEEVIARKAYDPERDLRNPADSVFCSHGAGVLIPWHEVYEHVHIPIEGIKTGDGYEEGEVISGTDDPYYALGTDEIDAIISGISGANKNPKKAGRVWKKKHDYYAVNGIPSSSGQNHSGKAAGSKSTASFGLNAAMSAFPVTDADCMLVDGYNVIFAWEDLKLLANDNIDSARDALIEILGKYSAMTDTRVIAVFDAYKVKGHGRENYKMHNIEIAFTSEDETADRYIERFTNQLGRKARVVVVTSDAAERNIARGQGCRIISSKEFRMHIEDLTENYNKTYGIE